MLRINVMMLPLHRDFDKQLFRFSSAGTEKLELTA